MNANIFHDHLDKCSHCNEHPFALCRAGQEALQAAVRNEEVEGTVVGDFEDTIQALKKFQQREEEQP